MFRVLIWEPPAQKENPERQEDAFVTRTMNEWHRTMGHLNERDLSRLPDLATGIKIQEGTSIKHPCEACITGKFTGAASKTPQKRETEKLRKVHSDTWTAPKDKPSLG